MSATVYPPGCRQTALFQSQIAILKSKIMKVLITAGPTREPIDAVRYIGNRSSGQMGAAIASNAIEEGHDVTLIAGPISAIMPAGAKRIDVETAQEMRDAVMREFPQHDLLIMAAAVAD